MGAKHNDPNKYGLKRYIGASIEQQIRKDAGYGCVVCGSLFCDYEHIEPEFHDAKKHDPEKMTMLCEACHGKVTGKRKSKKRVWDAKANPFCKQHGVVREEIEPCFTPTFEIGKSFVHDVEIILTVHGKPLMWLESPDELEEPFKVNAIFHNHKGELIACLNRNQFTSVIGSHDLWGEGTRIEIRPQKGLVGLTLNIEGDKPVRIDRINMSYLGTSIKVDKNGSIQLDRNNTIGKLHVESGYTAISIGQIPTARLKVSKDWGVYPLPYIAYLIARFGNPINTINGFHIGWLLGSFIINKAYKVVGYHEDKASFTITGEHIGELIPQKKDQYLLANYQNEYESYEPIWVSASDKATRNIRVDSYVDVTHRVFDYFSISRPQRNKFKPNDEGIPVPSHPTKYSIGQLKKREQELPLAQTYTIVDDSAKMGDRVIIDFEGKIEGVPFEGGTARDFPLEMALGRMITGFVEGIIGRTRGDSFDVEVQFSNNYHAENLKGKSAVFSVNLKRVERLNMSS